MTDVTTSETGALFRRAVLPFQEFFRMESASGILLLACAVAAIAWANSPWSAGYFHLWELPLTVGVGEVALSKSLHHWINDGLMAVFFFVVGLEIKREVLVGELASPRQAALPIAAAVGGMAAPALFYMALNAGTDAARGWAIPMATDIAFALGVLALLGKRAPLGIKVFLTAVAIVDDIGAVAVIALFYTAELSASSLGAAGLVLVALLGLNRAGVKRPAPYALLGCVLWYACLKSGVHATVAGVLLAMTIPARTRIAAVEFVTRGRELLGEFDASAGTRELRTKEQQALLDRLGSISDAVQSPLQRLEHGLHPWVAFGIMPLFALANAGVALEGSVLDTAMQPVTLGIILGLVLGKPIGITLFSWVAVRTGLAVAPHRGVWPAILGVSFLAGIGFTMSLFIADLGFGATAALAQAKLGILIASLIAGAAGLTLLRLVTAPQPSEARAEAPAPAPEGPDGGVPAGG